MTEPTRILPHDLDSERAVLGTILLHQPALYAASEVVTQDDFYVEAHRTLFQVMQSLHKAETGIDVTTVISELRRLGKLDQVGGPAYVAILTDGMSSAANTKHYAGCVKECSIKRQVLSVANAATESIFAGDTSASEALESLQAAILRLKESQKRTNWRKISEVVYEVTSELEELNRRHTECSGLDTGFRDLNRLTQGFHPGQLIIVAGRTGHGKTSLALNIIANSILRESRKVGLFTIEMSSREVVRRMLLSEAEVDNHLVGTGQAKPKDWDRIMQTAALLAETNLSIDEAGSLTIGDLRSKAQQLAAGQGIDLLVVDYLQIMATPSHRNATKAQEIGDISRGLKSLAKDLNVPVIALSQLSREVDKETNRRPRLTDLRDSGSIEQDADVVLFIWREELRSHKSEDFGEAELIIGKQRSGPVGETIKLTFTKQFTRFVDASPRTDEPRQRTYWGNTDD